jgi:cytidine deaminase
MLHNKKRGNERSAAYLIREACSILKNAYAPYSKYQVAAALLTNRGGVFKGTNVENASYGLTICAERNALFAAIAAGCKDFKMMAIVVSKGNSPVPCGACLQVLSEFCNHEFKIVSFSISSKKIFFYKLGELLPEAFVLKK